MIKDAKPDHPIDELISKRWSPRAFASRPVEREKLLSLLEAARWAPSSNNEQPWRFILALKEEDAFQRLLACLAEGNQIWVKEAPALMLSVAKLHFRDEVEKKNRMAIHDIGLAVQNLVVQAGVLGLYVHQMAGFDLQKARAAFQIPEHYEPVTAIAIGYLGDPAQLPENLRLRELAPRERKPLKELVFSARWGEISSLLE